LIDFSRVFSVCGPNCCISCISMDHTFSIILRSGDLAGGRITEILFVSKKVAINFEVCLGSLSKRSFQLSPGIFLPSLMIIFWRMLIYKGDAKFSLKI
jgi:hypothetical protein